MVSQCVDHQSIQGKRACRSWVHCKLLVLFQSEHVPMKSKKNYVEAA